MKKVQYWLLMGLMAFVFSCKKENGKNENPDQEQTDKVLNRILALGFSKKSIVEFEDYYLVEGDIRFPKKEPAGGIKVKQGQASNLVATKYALIRVYLNNSGFSGTMATKLNGALNDALDSYNTTIESELYFVQTTDPAQANIVVKLDNSILACGEGGYPLLGGEPYNEVLISELQSSGLNHSQLVYLLAHELGHNIGLRHTNAAAVGEAPSIPIPGTPATDPGSIMNAGTCGNSWFGFSNNDRIAITTLYPKLASGHSQVGTGTWSTTKAMTNVGDTLFAVDNQRLYRINKTTGVYTQIGTLLWTATKAMTSLNGFLYIVENQRIYKVSLATGVATILGPGIWTATDAMTSLNGWLYIVENQRLYQVDPATGTYTRQGSLFWTATEGMTSMGSSLYIVESQRLYEVNPTTGAATQLGGIIYGGTDAITSCNGWLYIVVHNRIYKVSTSGVYSQFGGSVWLGTSAMTSIGTDLFLVQNTRLYKIPT